MYVLTFLKKHGNQESENMRQFCTVYKIPLIGSAFIVKTTLNCKTKPGYICSVMSAL